MLHLPTSSPSEGQDASASRVLRALLPSVYLPTAIFSVGAGAAQPVLVLAATDVGMSHAAAAGVLGLMGAVGVVCAPLAGLVVSRLGGRRSMALGTLLAVVASAAIVATLTTHLAGASQLFMACVAATAMASNLWALARQGYVADAVTPLVRARALSVLGGMMRLGVLIGPALGSAVIIVGGRRGPFVLQAVAASLALAMVLHFALPTRELERERRQAARSSSGLPMRRLTVTRHTVDLPATTMVAVSMTCLQLLRTNRAVIVPLWGAHLGMSDALISATFAAGAVLDVAMFLPSGRWSDRYGRLAGVVPALVVMGASVVVTVVFTSPLGFVIGTCLMGLGNGFGSGIVMTMGADLAPTTGRERFLGWWQAVGNLGAAVGPFIVSALTASVGLTAGMWATAGLGLVGGAWACLAMPWAYHHAGMDMRGRPRTGT